MIANLESLLLKLRKHGYIATEDEFRSLLEANPAEEQEILRQRSKVLADMEQFEEARDDLLRVAKLSCSASDYYFSGEYAIQASDFEQALASFASAIRISESSGNDYYLSSSRLLAALACYQLNRDNECRSYLELVDDDTEVLWLVGFDRVTKKMIIDLL